MKDPLSPPTLTTSFQPQEREWLRITQSLQRTPIMSFAAHHKEAFVDYLARQSGATSMPPVIARLWTELGRSWMRGSARCHLPRSIGHLDDRLLTDIGLGAEDLGLTVRLARRHAAGLQNFWSLGSVQVGQVDVRMFLGMLILMVTDTWRRSDVNPSRAIRASSS